MSDYYIGTSKPKDEPVPKMLPPSPSRVWYLIVEDEIKVFDRYTVPKNAEFIGFL